MAVPSGSNFTIDFDGHTYTLIGPGAGSTGTETNGFQLLKDSNITFRDGVIRIAPNANDIYRIIQNYANLTLENMTFYSANQAGGEDYALSFNNGDIVFKGNTSVRSSSDDIIAFDICKFASYPSATVTFAEDYSGSAEISLFGDNFVNYFKYGSVGNAIRIKYTYQSSKYDSSKVFFSILDIQLLESVKGQIIQGIQLDLKEKDVENGSLQALLDRYMDNRDEDARNLYINIENEKEHKSILLASTDRIVLNKGLLSELEDNDIHYAIRSNEQ